MKKWIITFICLTAMVLNIQAMGKKQSFNPDFGDLWKQVKTYESKGQFQSALDLVEEIYDLAKQEENVEQEVKSFVYRIKFMSHLEEDGWRAAIARAEQVKSGASPLVSALEHSLLAEQYQSYYQRHQWDIANRHHTLDEKNDDVSTWSEAQFKATILDYFLISLSNEDSRDEKLKNYTAIVRNAKEGADQLPYLFDVLLYRAMTKIQDIQYRGAVQQKELFEAYRQKLDAMIPERIEELKKAGNEEAAIRMELMHATQWKAQTDSDYDVKKALASMTEAYTQSSVYPEIILAWVKSQNPGKDGDISLKEAKSILDDALKSHPKAWGAQHIQAYIQNQILRKTLDLQAEYAVPIQENSKILITYRNISTVYLHMAKVSPGTAFNNAYRDSRGRIELSKFDFDKPKKYNLPSTDDYLTHSIELRLPPREAGEYLVLITETSKCKYDQFGAGAFVKSTNLLSAWYQPYVATLDRITGAPVANVTVTAYQNAYNTKTRRSEWNEVGQYTSNEDGLMKPNLAQNQSVSLKLQKGEDVVYLEHGRIYSRSHRLHRSRNNSQAAIFTDRAMYRPGQTIHFKLVGYQTDADSKELRSNEDCQVVLKDVNGQDIQKLSLKTNMLGAACGSFDIPETVLPGRFYLESTQPLRGGQSIQVEAYKRPQVEVEFLKDENQLKLGDTIRQTIQAQTYFGSAIPDAKVQYKVSQSFFTPYYMHGRLFRGCYFPWRSTEVEIAKGETVTDSKGLATLDFLSELPDESFQGHAPWVRYKLSVSVIDATGERVDESKNIELTAETYRVQAAQNMDVSISKTPPFPFRLVNYEGQPAKADIQISVYKLESPDVPFMKERLWATPDQFSMRKEQFKEWFPLESYSDEFQINNWERKQLLSANMRVEGTSKVELASIIRDAGMYVIELRSDKDQILHSILIRARDQNSNSLPKGLDQVLIDHDSLVLGENTVAFATSMSDPQILVKTHNDKVRWLDHKTNVQLREKDRNGSFISWLTGKYNRFFTGYYRLPFNRDQKLNIEWLSDPEEEVLPGQEIEWRLKLTDSQGNPVVGEIMATVYDKSLDAYTEHNWATHHFQWPERHGDQWQLQGLGIGHNERLNNHQPYMRTDALVYPDLINHMQHYYDNVVVMRSADGSAPESIEEESMMTKDINAADASVAGVSSGPKKKDPPRTRLTEAPYFSKLLQSDKNGEVVIRHAASESLGAWKVMLLAYSDDFKYQLHESEYTTSKPLLVQPFVSRFLRSGDKGEISVRVINQMDNDVLVTVSIHLKDALASKTVNQWLTDGAGETFLLEAGQTRVLHFDVEIPADFNGILEYITSIKGGIHRDAERSFLPVLSSLKSVTESKTIFLEKEERIETTISDLGFNISNDQTSPLVTVESVAQPLWFVFKSLPYAQRKENESLTQLVNTYLVNTYLVNSLGNHALATYPWLGNVIQNMDDQSPLQRNEELNEIKLKYTPYLNQARSEAEEFGLIRNYYNPEKLQRTLNKTMVDIQSRQLSNGGFTWMPGGRDSWYLTQYVVDAITELEKTTGTAVKEDWFNRAISYTERAAHEYYREHYSRQSNKKHVSELVLQYLFTKSRRNLAFSMQEQEMWDTAKKNWLDYSLYSQAMIAFTLQLTRPESNLLVDIKKSFDERMIDGGDRGYFWKYNQGMRWTERAVYVHSFIMKWYHAMGDIQKMDRLMLWLIQNKRMHSWENKVSSIAAITTILECSDASDNTNIKQIEVLVDGNAVFDKYSDLGKAYLRETLEKDVESGTRVRIENPNSNVAWVNVFRNYTSPLSSIESSGTTGFSVKKEYYVRSEKSRITPLKSKAVLNKGDVIIVRLRISVDRDMEYVFLRDGRPAGLDPGVAQSGYQWNSGLSYYRAIQDEEDQFFIDFLPRGEHLIEYELQTTHAGNYSSGIAEIKCMYAPEFSAHSEGMRIEIE